MPKPHALAGATASRAADAFGRDGAGEAGKDFGHAGGLRACLGATECRSQSGADDDHVIGGIGQAVRVMAGAAAVDDGDLMQARAALLPRAGAGSVSPGLSKGQAAGRLLEEREAFAAASSSQS